MNQRGLSKADWDRWQRESGLDDDRSGDDMNDRDDFGPNVDRKNLPELIINSADPTATAKDLATLIAKRDDFLFNGHAPIRVAAEADCLPHALEVTTEMVRVLAHEICIPTQGAHREGRGRANTGPAEQRHRTALPSWARRKLGPQAVSWDRHGTDTQQRRDNPHREWL
jgi:hypothetical protein